MTSIIKSNAQSEPYFWQQQPWQLLINRYKNNTLPHALLLCGASGMGKLFFANKFSEFLLCQKETLDPDVDSNCGHCSSCRLLQAGTHPDRLIVQPEEGKKIIHVEQIRHLIEQLQQTPQQGRYQVVIIEPAEAMNIAASNALLKTLEEPLGNVFLFLVSHQPALISATIRSRCQRLVFTAASQQENIEQWLKSQLANQTDIKQLLKIAEGIPLKALKLEQEGELLKNKKLADNILELINGAIQPLKLVSQCNDFTVQEILTTINYLLLDIMKLKFSVANEYIFYENLLQKILPLTQKISLKKLMLFQDKILKINEALSKNVNLNAQLLLEDVFIELSQ